MAERQGQHLENWGGMDIWVDDGYTLVATDHVQPGDIIRFRRNDWRVVSITKEGNALKFTVQPTSWTSTNRTSNVIPVYVGEPIDKRLSLYRATVASPGKAH